MDIAELMRAVNMGVRSFDNDPADTPYQEGYRDALIELKRVMDGQPIPRSSTRLRLVTDEPARQR